MLLLNIGVPILMITASSFAGVSTNYNFRCEGPDKRVLKISYRGSRAEVLETGPQTSNSKKWDLPSMINLADLPRKPIRFYTSFSQNGDRSARNLFEVQEQYGLDGQDAQIKLAILREGQPLLHWKCFHTGVAVNVRLLEDILDFVPSEKLWTKQIARGFVTEESVSDTAIEMLKYSLWKYKIWMEQFDGATMKRVISDSGRALSNLSPKALKGIEGKLSGEEQKTWGEVLRLIDYQGSSPIQRWLFWAGLLIDDNKAAFRSSIREFAKSPLSKDKNTRDFFIKEARGAVSKVSISVRSQMRNEIWEPKEKELISEILPE